MKKNYLAVKWVGNDAHIIKNFGNDEAKAKAFCDANGYAVSFMHRLVTYKMAGLIGKIVK